MDTASEYIDFSENEELWKETNHMSGLGQSILEEGMEQGIEQRERQIILKNYSRGVLPKNIAVFLDIPIEKANAVISEEQNY